MVPHHVPQRLPCHRHCAWPCHLNTSNGHVLERLGSVAQKREHRTLSVIFRLLPREEGRSVQTTGDGESPSESLSSSVTTAWLANLLIDSADHFLLPLTHSTLSSNRLSDTRGSALVTVWWVLENRDGAARAVRVQCTTTLTGAFSNSNEAVVFPRLSDWLAVSVAYLPNTANLPEDGSTNASRHADAVATPMGNNCSLGGTPHILLQ